VCNPSSAYLSTTQSRAEEPVRGLSNMTTESAPRLLAVLLVLDVPQPTPSLSLVPPAFIPLYGVLKFGGTGGWLGL